MQKKPLPVDVVVGQNIYRYRRMRGVSQTLLAESLGVTFQQVQKYEKGSNRITVGKLVEVAHALNIPLLDLIQGSDAARENLAPIEGFSKADIEFTRRFTKLKDERVRRAILGLLKVVVRDNEPEDEAR